MIIGEFSDVVPVSVKMGAPAFDGGDQLGEFEEESVREGLVDDGPNALRGLKFGGVGGQEHEMNALGNLQVLCGVPTRPVDHEYGAFQRPNPLRFTVSPVEGRTKEKRYAHLYERRKAVWASSFASGCLGRGTCWVNPSFFMYASAVCSLTPIPHFVWIHLTTLRPDQNPPSGACSTRAVRSSASAAESSTGARPLDSR